MPKSIGAVLTLIAVTACATRPAPRPRSPELTRAIREIEQTVAREPENTPMIFLLALYRDRAGDPAGVVEALEQLERAGWDRGVERTDLTLKTPEIDAAVVRLNARERRILRSERVFTIGARDLIPEGIAWDPIEDAFYLSSIYRRKVVRVDRDGTVRDFIREGQDGMMAGLGMKVDPARRLLWVVSTSTPELRGYTPDLQGTAALHAYDLRDGSLVRKITLGSKEQPVFLNDIVALKDGTVYGTDTTGGLVWRLAPEASSFEAFVPAKTFRYPNGIAVSAEERFLFIAHYPGVERIDLRDGSRQLLPTPAPAQTLSGIDGLVFHENSLIGIQNAVGRPRVVRAFLNAALDTVTGIETLESGNPIFDMPATGVVAGNHYYFMANPQLRAFDENHNIYPWERLQDVVIVRIPLT